MIINLEKLYPMQRELDAMVEGRVLNNGYELGSFYHLEDLNYAFHTEVHELANELGFFKFWKLNHPINENEAKEEFVDCIHLLLSLALVRGYDKYVKEVEIPELFVALDEGELFRAVRELTVDTLGRYTLALQYMLAIGKKLGVDDSELLDIYTRKNEINKERQREGY